MRLLGWLILLGGVFSVCLIVGAAASRFVEKPSSAHAKASNRGEMLYTMHCAKCHGDEGHGDAEGAEKLVPPPRNFAARPWRYEPTESSIARVISRGIPGTSMPAFGATLLDADIEALTTHVLSLASANESVPPTADPFAAAKFARLRIPRTASPLALVNAAEEKLTLSDLQGNVVLLNFWGTSCEHCLAKMPALEQLEERFANRKFVVVNICADEDDAAEAQQMVKAVAPALSTYVDPTGLVNSRYEVSLMPTIWLLDQKGQLIAKAQGARDWNEPALAALIESLLAEHAE